MAGYFHKERSGGQMRPDWTLIGYSDCPQTTLDGHQYAVDIHDNWDPTLTNAYQMFYQDYQLMYFPKNIDTTGLTNMQQMFKESNIEDLYIDCSGVTGQGFNEICKTAKNLRYVNLVNVDASGITTLANSFQDCYALDYIDFNPQPGRDPGIHYITSLTSIDHICSGCRSLKEFHVLNGSGDTTLTNCGDAFRDCYAMEELEITADGCNRFGAYEMGKNTTNGTVCKINIGGYNNNDGQYNLQGCKIAKGSDIQIYRVGTTQNEMFKYSTIDVDSTTWFWVESAYNQDQNCAYMFSNARFPSGLSNMQAFKIADIGNARGMFRATHFSGTNKTIDMSNFGWGSCSDFLDMFNGSEATHITGTVDMSSATNLQNMFAYCNNLDNDTVDLILSWLVTATAYTGTKTLAYLGFTSANYPAATIQSLTNYTAFTTAGWTIGY